MFPLTSDDPDPVPCAGPCALVETLCAVCFPCPSHTDANMGCCWEWGALFPKEGGPQHPRLGLFGAPAARFWQKRGFPVAPNPVSSGVVIGNMVPPSHIPNCAGTWDSAAEDWCTQGRFCCPRGMFCSGSFTPTQANVGIATSFKIWPQTFITQC